MTEGVIRPLRALAEVQLGRQRSPDRDQGPNMVRYLRAANVKDGALSLDDVKEMDFTLAEQRTFALAPGDVLVSEGAGSLAAVGASAVWSGEIEGTVCFQNTLLRLRPRPGVDPRFLMWWASHAYASGLFSSIATGANIYHLGAERVRLLPAAMPGTAAQRAIAGYLDNETGRIDSLVAARRRQVELLALRRRALISSSLDVGPAMPVRRIIRLCTSGPRGWGDLVCEEGVMFIRSANLAPESIEIKRDHMAFVPAQSSAEGSRSRVRVGDTLVGITGANTGWTGLVRGPLDGSFVSQHVAILRPAGVLPEWLAYSIASERGQRTLLGSQYGGTKTQLGLEDLRELLVRVPDLETQRTVIDRIARIETDTASAIAAMHSQIDVLLERRQALITAAVTGQLEIPGVAA